MPPTAANTHPRKIQRVRTDMSFTTHLPARPPREHRLPRKRWEVRGGNGSQPLRGRARTRPYRTRRPVSASIARRPPSGFDCWRGSKSAQPGPAPVCTSLTTRTTTLSSSCDTRGAIGLPLQERTGKVSVLPSSEMSGTPAMAGERPSSLAMPSPAPTARCPPEQPARAEAARQAGQAAVRARSSRRTGRPPRAPLHEVTPPDATLARLCHSLRPTSSRRSPALDWVAPTSPRRGHRRKSGPAVVRLEVRTPVRAVRIRQAGWLRRRPPAEPGCAPGSCPSGRVEPPAPASRRPVLYRP